MSQHETHHFQAEIQQLLNIVIHSLYTDKEIFVRELVSNAADACEKLRFHQSSGQPVYQAEIAPAILVTTDESAGTITITDTGLNKVEQMACFIAQNYTEKLTVQQIGEFVKLHPNYAMNLFQKTFGSTLINYLTQHRISHAQRLLATTTQTVTEIAFQSGFLSISRFNEAFRRACGCSPREYRKVHELEVAVAPREH